MGRPQNFSCRRPRGLDQRRGKTVGGAQTYCAALSAGEATERWLGIECCGFHIDWTKEACPKPTHNLYLDDTLLTLAALREGTGLAYLPCFMGDNDPGLRRFRPPEPRHDLGLWRLYHRDPRRTERVSLFRTHMLKETAMAAAVCEGILPAPE